MFSVCTPFYIVYWWFFVHFNGERIDVNGWNKNKFLGFDFLEIILQPVYIFSIFFRILVCFPFCWWSTGTNNNIILPSLDFFYIGAIVVMGKQIFLCATMRAFGRFMDKIAPVILVTITTAPGRTSLFLLAIKIHVIKIISDISAIGCIWTRISRRGSAPVLTTWSWIGAHNSRIARENSKF